MKLLHEDLTHKIRHCIFEVRNEIGAGFDEETYHQGLLLSFERNGLPFVSKEKCDLTHRGVFVRSFINDFLLDDKVLLSVKCVPCKFLQAHYVQLFSELKLWKKDLGMIVNFGLPDLDIERYAFTEKNPTFVEDKVVLMIVALQKTIDQSEIANMQSYLKALKLPAGIIVNFGKSEIHVSGVRPA